MADLRGKTCSVSPLPRNNPQYIVKCLIKGRLSARFERFFRISVN